MKIAVIGSSLESDKNILKKAEEIGREIARNNCVLFVGGCRGYPEAAAKGAFEERGTVIAISPAKDKEEHIKVYDFPTDVFSEIRYTGLGIPGRNMFVVKEADAVIMVSGQIGTLNEFTIAFHAHKPIGVLKGSGGITEIVKQIAEYCDTVGEKDKIIYDPAPKELVEKLLKAIATS